MRHLRLSLPAEIVAEIFTEFLPTYPECPPLHGLHSPSLLGQICGLWRAIAFSTPSLWRAVEIKLSEDDSLRSPQPTKHITVNVDPIVDTIIGHSHRLEYFDVHMPLESLLTIEGAMPLLKHRHSVAVDTIDAHRCPMPLRY
ncbi:hypothetical protein R3P38DRAFT_3090086 [Favolaschia claudopus]|uniref:F-box domain-containing protein n=1 Tax=Favolaschia claudopus TaxID=2862362 RepID=A0AAV9ZT70_9AGAR